MSSQPLLSTQHLVLRPFTLEDAADVKRLAGDHEIASTTLLIPHPYEDGMAEEWIETHRKKVERGELAVFAITDRRSGELFGAISLKISRENDRAEMGYWIGKPYWNRGYCTEAARAVIEYGFKQIGLNRIYAHYMTRNPASGRVLQKIGMKFEGHLRQHVKKWDSLEDLELYAILASEFVSSGRN